MDICCFSLSWSYSEIWCNKIPCESHSVLQCRHSPSIFLGKCVLTGSQISRQWWDRQKLVSSLGRSSHLVGFSQFLRSWKVFSFVPCWGNIAPEAMVLYFWKTNHYIPKGVHLGFSLVPRNRCYHGRDALLSSNSSCTLWRCRINILYSGLVAGHMVTWDS